MNYCTINNAFENDICRAIQGIAQKATWHSKVVQLAGEGECAFFPDQHWLSGFAFHYAATANNENWNFSILGTSAVQICRYREGEGHEWHIDALGYKHSSMLDRKLTVVIDYQTERDDLVGGDLELMLTPQDHAEKIVKLVNLGDSGAVYIFPSYIPFRINPVARGVREFAICWALGNQFV